MGDAPESYGTPGHILSPAYYLGGAMPDSEEVQPHTVDADGDGNDEDGIQLPALTGGRSAEIVATVRGDDGYLQAWICLLYTSPSPRDGLLSRMPSSA